MANKISLSEDSKVSLPAKNLISIIFAILVGAFFLFQIIERLNIIETELQLMQKDLAKSNEFIENVPKGELVAPQIQELFFLVEYTAKDLEKIKKQIEEEIPNIKKNDMTIQFHEERIIDIEQKQNGTYQ
tara:strand:- start:8024 stop:8413 length:390 start_codon:yes stop_codon:yes gene_type:complete